MATLKTVLDLKPQLKSPEPKKVVKTLKKLQELDITIEILTETGIGKLVNSFRKHDEVGEVAKKLVTRWKKLVPKENRSKTKLKDSGKKSPTSAGAERPVEPEQQREEEQSQQVESDTRVNSESSPPDGVEDHEDEEDDDEDKISASNKTTERKRRDDEEDDDEDKSSASNKTTERKRCDDDDDEDKSSASNKTTEGKGRGEQDKDLRSKSSKKDTKPLVSDDDPKKKEDASNKTSDGKGRCGKDEDHLSKSSKKAVQKDTKPLVSDDPKKKEDDVPRGKEHGRMEKRESKEEKDDWKKKEDEKWTKSKNKNDKKDRVDKCDKKDRDDKNEKKDRGDKRYRGDKYDTRERDDTWDRDYKNEKKNRDDKKEKRDRDDKYEKMDRDDKNKKKDRGDKKDRSDKNAEKGKCDKKDRVVEREVKAQNHDNEEEKDNETEGMSFEDLLNYDAVTLKKRSGVKKKHVKQPSVAKRDKPRTPTAKLPTKVTEEPKVTEEQKEPPKMAPSKPEVLDLLNVPLPLSLPNFGNLSNYQYYEEDSMPADPEVAEDETSIFMGKRLKNKMLVYSGSKNATLPTMMSLYQLCIRALQNNIDSLYEVGGVPFEILEPVLARCTPEQLSRIEKCNPGYIGLTDHLWDKHCQRDFKDARLQEYESWREMFFRLFEERERKLASLTKSIVSAHSQKPKGRQIKMAFLDCAAKPPRNVRVQQGIHGTAGPMVQCLPRERLRVQCQDSEVRSAIRDIPRPSSSSSSSTSSSSFRAPEPPKIRRVAPMMAKSLRNFKQQRRHR